MQFFYWKRRGGGSKQDLVIGAHKVTVWYLSMVLFWYQGTIFPRGGNMQSGYHFPLLFVARTQGEASPTRFPWASHSNVTKQTPDHMGFGTLFSNIRLPNVGWKQGNEKILIQIASVGMKETTAKTKALPQVSNKLQMGDLLHMGVGECLFAYCALQWSHPP